MEEWREIKFFPRYSVSDTGRIRNDDTGRILSLHRNQNGIVYVGLVRGSIQHIRSVSLMVARAFLPLPKLETFDTPINYDGDRENNHVYNLTWRPRWFAVKYFRQFTSNHSTIFVPIVDTETGEEYSCSWEAAIKNGLIDCELVVSIFNKTFVWPTFQRFSILGK